METMEVEEIDSKEMHRKPSSVGSLPDEMQDLSTAPTVTLIAKFGKERLTLEDLAPATTIGQVKLLLQEQTRILPSRQKLLGLQAQNGGARGITDNLPLEQLKQKDKSKPVFQFILMGTPEEAIIAAERPDDLPDVVDDFDLEFHAGSEEWLRHVANGENLKKFTEETAVHIMHEPRPNKPLLVLDLDHTLLDFSSKSLLQTADGQHATTVAQAMKRPHMDEFLTKVYPYFDLVVWSQTSWRWLETKLIELGMLTHTGYRFCFVLDKTSMFQITSEHPKQKKRVHHVKPLQIIWSKFGTRWGLHNTVHVDDLSRNFALNPGAGLLCTAYYRRKQKRKRDAELLAMAKYLVELAKAQVNFEDVDFKYWREVAQGTRELVKKEDKAE